jgi:hypothetical protein
MRPLRWVYPQLAELLGNLPRLADTDLPTKEDKQ